VCNVIEPILERGYIHHSYACRIGKGTHSAVRQAQIFSRKNRYYLKCDIRQYFGSIDHDILKKLIVRKFKDPDLIWLLNTIIDSAQSDQPGKGIPIGSLTSQHFANLYLDRLDHYIKDSLRVKGYLRYMDDFILFGYEKADLHSLHDSIRNFLHDVLELELKEKATMLAPVLDGIPFLGFRIFPNIIRLKQENKKRAFNTLKSRTRAFEAGEISEAEYSRSLMSITEHLKIANSYNLRKDVFNRMSF